MCGGGMAVVGWAMAMPIGVAGIGVAGAYGVGGEASE